MKTNNSHIPVLGKEVVEFLTADLKQVQTEKLIFMDGTLGGGGYTKLLVDTLNDQSIKEKSFEVWASDLDQKALSDFREGLDSGEEKMVVLNQGNFANVVKKLPEQGVAGMTLDLGFSSIQLDEEDRGFSYHKLDQILDLRYNPETDKPLYVKLRGVKDAKALSKIIFQNSGEKMAPKFANLIFDKVRKKQMKTVSDLVSVIESGIPEKMKNKKNQILSRIWQAFRIWVNDELASLENFLPLALSKLAVGGRLAIVCFHSLEDKIVTNYMRTVSKLEIVNEYGDKTSYFKLLTPKSVTASLEELENNPRSRSATLRVLEKIK